MRRELAPIGWLAASLLLLWLGGMLLGLGGWWLAIGSAAATLSAVGTVAVRRLRMRAGAPDPARALAREVDAGIRAARAAGAGALPWFLVLGAAGSGKSSALAAGGCAPLSAPGACRWWLGAGAVFIEATAGAPDDLDPLLRALARRRRRPALGGAVATLALPELLAADEPELARRADALRGCLDRVGMALAAEIPVWLVLTRADHLGGFKEFAVALGEAERRAAFGIDLGGAAGIADALAALAAATRTRRLLALDGAAGDERARKVFQFPGQLAAAQRWIAALLGRLGGDGAHGLRGVYLGSALPSASRLALDTAPAGAFVGAAVGAPASRCPATIFLETRQLALSPAPVPIEAAAGIFLRQVFAEIVPASAALARPAERLRRSALAARWALAAGVPAAAALIAVVVLWRAAATVDLAHGSRYALSKSRAAARDEAATLAALEALEPPLAAAARQPGAEALADLVAKDYYRQLERLLLGPAARRIAEDLDQARAKPGDSARLEELLRAYRMLGGELAPEAAVLGRVLAARWAEGDAARRRLDFLLAHLDDTRGWTIAIDRHAVALVEHELEESLWLREAYDGAEGALQASYPVVDRDRLVSGPFRDALEVGGAFPGLFTQEGWDQAMRPVLAARAKELARRFAAIGAPRSAREIESRLDQRFADDLAGRWLGLLAACSAHGVTTLADAPGAIALLAGRQSPYRELVAATWRSDRLRSGLDLGALRGAERLEWLDRALDALATLGHAVEGFLAATEPGKRSADARRLRELAEAFDAASLAVTTAAKAIDDRARQAAVVAGLHGILRSLLAGASADLLVEQDRLWNERARRPFSETLAGRYPLDPLATVEATPESFSHLFNPVTGTLWSAAASIEELRAVRALGVELLPVSASYEAFMRHAKDIRQAMFADNGERIRAPFTLALRLREGVKDLRAAIGEQTAGVYDRPDGKGQFAWRETGPETARIAITSVTGQVFATEIPSGPWAAIRLIRAGAPIRRGDGWVCTWSFAAAAVGREASFKADAVLPGGGFAEALAGDLLTGLACPETIGR